MKNVNVSTILVLALSGCVSMSGISPPSPGTTVASGRLLRDAMKTLTMIEKSYGKSCTAPKSIVNVELIEQPANMELSGDLITKGKFVERWTINRCGELVTYKMSFTPDGQGGAYIGIQPEKK